MSGQQYTAQQFSNLPNYNNQNMYTNYPNKKTAMEAPIPMITNNSVQRAFAGFNFGNNQYNGGKYGRRTRHRRRRHAKKTMRRMRRSRRR